MGRENVILDEIAADNIGPDWPSGKMILDSLKSKNVSILGFQENPEYWQASARWALLKGSGILDDSGLSVAYESGQGSNILRISDRDMEDINQQWQKVLGRDDLCNDLTELLGTRKSNKRSLKWTFMDCSPGCQFNLHAHPNIELVYCCRGQLHPSEVIYNEISKITSGELTETTRNRDLEKEDLY